jgi:hypothetical protein
MTLRRSHKRALALITMSLCAVVIGVGAAQAWSQQYVTNATWTHGSKAHSDYNSNLKGNAIYFTNPWGGSPQMGSRYIDSGGNGINSYQWSNTGTLVDTRTVSYGAAECKANDGNSVQVYIYSCGTNN